MMNSGLKTPEDARLADIVGDMLAALKAVAADAKTSGRIKQTTFSFVLATIRKAEAQS